MDTATSPHQDPIRGAVRVLAAYRDQSQAEVAIGAGIPKRTLIRRMQTGGWTVQEVSSLARHFGVSVPTILDGPDAMLGGVMSNTSGYSGRSRHGEAIPALVAA